MIVTLCSGEGRTFAAVTRVRGTLVTDMITNVAAAPVREKARSLGVTERCVPHISYASRREHEEAVFAELKMCKPFQMIFLLGYMRVLSLQFLNNLRAAWPQCSIVNLHPAPLSLYKGANGLVHALKIRAPLWGISVHEVTAKLDEGPLLAYRSLVVHPNDTFELLRERAHTQEVAAVLEAIDKLSRRQST